MGRGLYTSALASVKLHQETANLVSVMVLLLSD